MARIRKQTALRAVAALAVAGLVLALALFIRAYQVTDDDPVATGPLPTTGATASVIGAPPTSVTAKKPAGHGSTYVAPGGSPLTLSAAARPGLVIRGVPTHTLTMRVTSAAPIPRIGYFVPTSSDSSTGDLKNLGRTWSRTTKVTGKPDYAVLFVQANAEGTPQTCSITVDGVVRSTKTTHGPYGRQVCYA